MEKLTTLTGVAVPLRRSNVDTDQIIPAVDDRGQIRIQRIGESLQRMAHRFFHAVRQCVV